VGLAAGSLPVIIAGLVAAGLARLMGSAGVGVGALLLVIVRNPLSGIATQVGTRSSPTDSD